MSITFSIELAFQSAICTACRAHEAIQQCSQCENYPWFPATGDHSMNLSNDNAWFLQELLGLKPEFCGNMPIVEARERALAALELVTKRPEEIAGTACPFGGAALAGMFKVEGATMVSGTAQDAARALNYLQRLTTLIDNGIADGASFICWG